MRAFRAVLPRLRPDFAFLSAGLVAVSMATTAWAQPIQLPPAIAGARKIVICADIGSPPLSFYKDDGSLAGAEIELGNAIANQLGVSAEWKQVQFDGTCGASSSAPSRPASARPLPRPAARRRAAGF